MSLSKTSRPNAASQLAASNTVPTLRQTFNNTTNWTVPTGVNAAVLVMAGGGGAGGTGSTGTNFGSAGGAAGGVGIRAIAVTPGTTIAITIGAGANTTNTSNTTGANGGATTVDVGDIRYTANGGTGGQPGNNNNGGGVVNATGNFGISNKTVGVVASEPVISTNFVLETFPYVQAFAANTHFWNSIYGYNNGSIGSTAGMGVTSCDLNLGNIRTYVGSSTNLDINDGAWVSRFAGGGGSGGVWDANNTDNVGYRGSNNILQGVRDGISGLAGGGGGSSNLNGRPSGAGGGGQGGIGGAQNNTVQRGGGGGAGLTGDGATNTTSSGGAGGTGGGGGGAGVHSGTGGAGGAGAVLIYY